MADVTLLGLRVIRAVIATGSFTAAAHALGYTQSAISRQVAVTEAAVGAVLFERGARGVVPSPAGEVLGRHASRILSGVLVAQAELDGLVDELDGQLATGAFPTAAAVLVPRALAQVAADHPGLRTTFEEGSTPALLRALRAGRLEVVVVGVGEGLPDHDLDGLRQEVLSAGDLRIAVSADHPLADCRQVQVADLKDEAWIVGNGSPGDPQFGAWPTLAHPRVVHAARAWPTRLGMVAAGLGIAVLPGLAARSVPAGVRVLTVEDHRWTGRAALAVTAVERSRGADAMVAALRQQAARLQSPAPA